MKDPDENRRLEPDRQNELKILGSNIAMEGGEDDGAGVTPLKPRNKDLQEAAVIMTPTPRTPQRKRRRSRSNSEGQRRQ